MSSAMLSRRRALQTSLALIAVPFDCGSGFASPFSLPEPGKVFDVSDVILAHRAEGPRIESEQMGDTLVVHNYGHGESAWSLSWGAAEKAVRQAMAVRPAAVAVIGAGVIGLTSALLAQRAGARVALYARALLPQTSSARALGLWRSNSPDLAGPSLAMHRAYANRAGTLLEWKDHYDVRPAGLRRTKKLQFNIADYSHALLADYFGAGGTFVAREFHTPAELQTLDEKVVIDCTGYGARDLWKDRALVPRVSRIAWLTPQPDMHGFTDQGITVVSRRDVMAVDLTEHARKAALERIAALYRKPGFIRSPAGSSA